jgi:hypothetical protein
MFKIFLKTICGHCCADSLYLADPFSQRGEPPSPSRIDIKQYFGGSGMRGMVIESTIAFT